MTKIQAEIMQVFVEAKDIKYPDYVLALSNFNEKKLKLSRYEEKLKSKVLDIVEKYKILNFNKKEEEKLIVGRKAVVQDKEMIEVNTDDVRWFVYDLPESEEQELLVISYFYNNFPNLTKSQSIQIFGSYDNSRNIYNSLIGYAKDAKGINPDMQELQLYILDFIAVIESDFYSIFNTIKDLEKKELNMLKNKVDKLPRKKHGNIPM